MAMPSSSWVAKWNNLEGMVPGIYAIKILDDSPYEVVHEAKSRKKSKDQNNEDLVYSDDEEDFYA